MKRKKINMKRIIEIMMINMKNEKVQNLLK